MARPLVVHVVGARPNYMKVAPVYADLDSRGNVDQQLIHTGQHYDLLMKDVFFAELPLPHPHVQLDGKTLEDTLSGLEGAFRQLSPELVIVAGDVNSTLAGAVAARKLGIRVCHIESGLRSNDWTMPEERNRVIADHLSALLLTHSDEADQNLVAEGVPVDRIALVGNTMIDTLRANESAALELSAWEEYGLEPGGYVLVTLHRPNLVDDPDLLARTVAALEEVAQSLPVIFPVHPRTRRTLEGSDRVILTEPLSYRHFLSLEAKAAAVVTDSGGIQEETTVLRVPCFTLRANTERPVTIDVGTNTLLGLDPDRLRELPSLLAEPKRGEIPPLWDGRAGERAGEAIEELLVGATV
jgi:UDP-N-acetylglucosamine 2-epimerase (non-hydrolysing)